MKSFGGIVVALVVGIVLGAWQPRGEVLALREKLDDAEARAAKECRGGGFQEIQGLLGGAGGASPGAAPRRVVTRTGDDGPAEPDAPPDDGLAVGVGDTRKGPPTPAELSQQLDTLQAGLDARRAHALQALTEQAHLDDAQRADVESILDQMNGQLRQQVDHFVDDAVSQGQVDRRDVLDFGADALDTVIATDDAIRGALDEEQYAALDDELTDPLSYVSGDTVQGLTRAATLPGFWTER